VSKAAASALLGLAALVAASPAVGQAKYDLGASAVEIKIGSVMPFSGPFAAYGMIGKTEAAYFDKVNRAGGVNGRKIALIAYDDGFDPPTTLQAAQRLVERDEVLLIFQSLGTAQSAAIQKYLNRKRIPQLFVASGASRFGDAAQFPWTMGWQPSYETEGRIYAKYLIDNHPNGKLGVLLQKGEAGKDYLKGLQDGLGGRIPILFPPGETAEATVAAQVAALKAADADILFVEEPPDVTARAIGAAAEIGWKPVFVLASISSSVDSILEPTGLDNAQGLLSAAYMKGGSDRAWQTDTARLAWASFMDAYYPAGDKMSEFPVYGYLVAQTMVQVLKQCGDDLTRRNVMRQAANLKDLRLGMLLPGIRINTAPDDHFPIQQMQMERFGGEGWHLFGPVIGGGRGTAEIEHPVLQSADPEEIR
jgi:branched-chain amino acid transport system substrate-binding protein